MLFLSRNNTGTDPYSSGTGTNRIEKSVSLDGSSDPPNELTTPKEVFLYATDNLYEGINVAVVNNPVGITWEISMSSDGTYLSAVWPWNMNATSEDQVVSLWLRATVANDGSVETQFNTECVIRIQATDSPFF